MLVHTGRSTIPIEIIHVIRPERLHREIWKLVTSGSVESVANLVQNPKFSVEPIEHPFRERID